MGFVERVEMDARDAGAQQFFALMGGVIDAEFGHGLVISAEFFQAVEERFGQTRPAHGGEALDLGPAHDRNDARANRHAYLELVGQVVPKFKKIRVVEKKLSEDKLRAGINLFLEMLPINVASALAGHVSFRKPGGPDAKAARFADEAHELIGVFKAAFGLFENAAAARRVAAQGEDILDAQGADLRDDIADFIAGRVHASEVGHGGQPVLALDAVHDHQGFLARAAAGAVGDRAIIRLELQQGRDGFLKKVFVAVRGLWRKKLAGNDRTLQFAFCGGDVSNVWLREPGLESFWLSKIFFCSVVRTFAEGKG